MFLMSIATMLTTVPSKKNETVSRIHINRRPKDLVVKYIYSYLRIESVQYMELILFSSMNASSAEYYQLVNVGISTIRMKNNKETASCDVDC